MSRLDQLAQHKDTILLAELAGLLHNVGKLNPNFLKSTVNNEGEAVTLLRDHSQFEKGYAFKRFAKPSEDILDPSVKTLLANKNKMDPSQLPKGPHVNDLLEQAQQRAAETFNKFYRGTGPLSDSQAQALSQVIEVADEKWRLTDLLTLFWDEFFYKPHNDDYQRIYALDRWLTHKSNGLPHLLIHAHGEMSGSEKYQIATDEDAGITTTTGVKQEKASFDNLRSATVFGYETEIAVWGFRRKQKAILERASRISLEDGRWRLGFQATLRHGLGDAQRPINEITLWDYASSIAALFKVSVAKSFLEGHVADANQMYWRLLGVRFDGLDYLLQADRIADILGRQQKYNQTLNQICISLTQDIPVASLVYQDENGLFFVVPDSDVLKLQDLQDLIKEQLSKNEFDDLKPRIEWSQDRLRGKQLNLGRELERQSSFTKPSIDLQKAKGWWTNRSAQICNICGLRPTINKNTTYCTECRNNRQSRMQTWLDAPKITIWLDEVADENGRLALITGQFPLGRWLDGTFVESLALGMDEAGKPVSKFASFPRVQRIWQTTQTFWKQSQSDMDQSLTDSRRRLKIRLTNSPKLSKNQTYELSLRNHTRMSVLWTGEYLISIDNLSYTALQLDIDPEERKTPVDAALAVGVWLEDNIVLQLTSDDKKNKRFDIQIANVEYQESAYASTISILAEPRTFMALVPADKALDILQAVQTKYAREMGKVRNRLPLHMGVVYFQRRTPLRAALDAGRRMLRYNAPQTLDQTWEVQSVQSGALPDDQQRLAAETQQFATTIAVKLKRDGRSFTWYVPAKMGDGQTDDHWYPYVFTRSNVDGRRRIFKALRPTAAGTNEECRLVHAAELIPGDEVYFTPATFDFEWLDTSARRFEIAYDESGARYDHTSRPYLLDELSDIQKAWTLLSQGLTSSQIYALRDTIETRRDAWQAVPDAPAFKQLCSDTIRNAQWKSLPDANKIEKLTAWAASGLLADSVELYMGIMKQKPQRDSIRTGEETV